MRYDSSLAVLPHWLQGTHVFGCIQFLSHNLNSLGWRAFSAAWCIGVEFEMAKLVFTCLLLWPVGKPLPLCIKIIDTKHKCQCNLSCLNGGSPLKQQMSSTHGGWTSFGNHAANTADMHFQVRSWHNWCRGVDRSVWQVFQCFNQQLQNASHYYILRLTFLKGHGYSATILWKAPRQQMHLTDI